MLTVFTQKNLKKWKRFINCKVTLVSKVSDIPGKFQFAKRWKRVILPVLELTSEGGEEMKILFNSCISEMNRVKMTHVRRNHG